MQKNLTIFILPLCMAFSCQSQAVSNVSPDSDTIVPPVENPVQAYAQRFEKAQGASQSKGSVSDGSLIHGRLMPFEGPNFRYFDTTSYLNGRAFVHEKVCRIVVDAYALLAVKIPERKFCIMECSQEHGGEMFPHKTHQNGTSVDFMMPKLKDGKPFYELDSLGAEHYWLSFDAQGRYSEDPTITIDFETLAQHLLCLDDAAQKQGYGIDKVIFKMEMKDELLATPSGKQLLKRGIYITKKLSPLINELHDEHYHVDFEMKSSSPKGSEIPNKSK